MQQAKSRKPTGALLMSALSGGLTGRRNVAAGLGTVLIFSTRELPYLTSFPSNQRTRDVCRFALNPVPGSHVAQRVTVQRFSRLRKNPSALSFRGAEGDEESRKAFIFRARFLRLVLFGAGMTQFRNVFPQHVRTISKSIEPHVVYLELKFSQRRSAGKQQTRNMVRITSGERSQRQGVWFPIQTGHKAFDGGNRPCVA